MLNFTERTGCGAVMLVWSFLLATAITRITNIHIILHLCHYLSFSSLSHREAHHEAHREAHREVLCKPVSLTAENAKISLGCRALIKENLHLLMMGRGVLE